MRIDTAWILGLASIMFCVAALAGPPASKRVDVRDLMTVTEFKQAGLNKLSPDELKVFNIWLNQYLNSRAAVVTAPPVAQAASAAAAATPAAAASGAAGFGADTMAPKESVQTPSRIETRIAGMFTGWTGDTLFPLENGQVWQQAATGYFTEAELDHPGWSSRNSLSAIC